MTLSAGDILQNRYRIVKLVGQGGFGAVYRAWDLSLTQPVALKENSDSGVESQRQFEREAKLLAGLRHTNLPVVIDHFILPGRGQYLVMDFVEGKSLRALLVEHGGALNEAEVLPWIRQVCGALTYLHTRTPPVIHRDIKPDNIIITSEGRAMLVDFGISKVHDPGVSTTIGAKAVTPGYSAPEQYGRGRTDARSDVYSLGATLYTLLTGETPPDGPDLASGADTLIPIRQLNPAISEATSAAIVTAMAPTMSQRLGSTAELGQLLAPNQAAIPARSVMPMAATARLTTEPGKAERRFSPIILLVGIVALVALATLAWLVIDRGNGDRSDAATSVPTDAAVTVRDSTPRATPTSQPSPASAGDASATDLPVPTPAATQIELPTEVASATQVIPPTSTPEPAPVWPISDTGDEACHLTDNETVTMADNARLWPQPNAGVGTSLTSLASGQRATVLSGPSWGTIRRDIDYNGWWWEVEAGGQRGWVWEDRLQECAP